MNELIYSGWELAKKTLLRLVASAASDDAASDNANSDDAALNDAATEDSCQTLEDLIDNGEGSGGEESSRQYVGDAVAVVDGGP